LGNARGIEASRGVELAEIPHLEPRFGGAFVVEVDVPVDNTPETVETVVVQFEGACTTTVETS
jgi:hypothetical protein